MKLLNDLFEITESSANESGLTVIIKLFAGHIIYSGHFPGHPVTPGAVQLQIIHELLEHHFGKRIQLIALDDCKFLKIVNPEKQEEIRIAIQFNVDGQLLQVTVLGNEGEDVFLKLKGKYRLC